MAADVYGSDEQRGSARTVADYRSTLERNAVPFLGKLKLREVQIRHLKLYAAHIAERGVSVNTVRLALAPVKAMFADAHEEGLIPTNPSAGLRLATKAPVENEDGEIVKAKAITEEELKALLAAIPARYTLMFELMAVTGLRTSELLALQVRHLDFGRCRVLVRRRLYRGVYASPKSRFGSRDVPLSKGMAQRLWTLYGAAYPGALLFCTEAGTAYDRANLRRVFKKAAATAGVPWASFHTLRHTCATLLFESGKNVKQVQAWLGHHSASFTLDVYIHLMPDGMGSRQTCSKGWASRSMRPHRTALRASQQRYRRISYVSTSDLREHGYDRERAPTGALSVSGGAR